MRVPDVYLVLLGIVLVFRDARRLAGPGSVLLPGAGARAVSRRDDAYDQGSRRTSSRSNMVAEGGGGQLLGLFVEMQKRSEAKEGLPHTREEEKQVDYFFESDIILTVSQAEQILRDMTPRRRRKRKLAEPLAKRWPNPIPYIFDGSHNLEERHRIRKALSYWEELTCLHFTEDRAAEHKLQFVKGRGCWSYVGYTNQVNQTISIGPGCQSNGTIAHEVGHAIGFWHEQSRPDRDDNIIIHKYNVTSGKIYNFDKRTWGEIVTLDIPYDLGSDMHYGSKFYAKDENSTCTTVETRDALKSRVVGQRQELSFYDVKLANKAYCSGICGYKGVRLARPCQREGYQDPRECTRCRCPDGFAGDYCELVSPGVGAHCGGILYTHPQLNGTLVSPGYMVQPYRPGLKCSWLIKAPNGRHVYLLFEGMFGISGHVDVCKDYVEVRYNTSLALTGARFCCDDPPRRPLRSDKNEMLVLFRTFHESRACDDLKYPWKCKQFYTGFKATFFTKSCGGCGNLEEDDQPACVKEVSYTCARSWQAKIKPTNCNAWWYSPGCGASYVTKTRYATCRRDEYYCCDRYVLSGRICKSADAQKRSFSSENSPIEHLMTQDSAAPPVWSEWSHWGRCTASCGGGIQVRTRRCLIPQICSESNLQFDRRPCAEKPCYKVCRAQIRDRCDVWRECTRIIYRICGTYCNKGFAKHGDWCVDMEQ